MDRILVVDPDEHITSLLSGSLQSEGYCVDIVTGSIDALTREPSSYRLIISEVRLEEIDGFELLERLRDMDDCHDMPFIFCTECDSESDIIRGLNSGADDYVVKPFSLREFLARVRSVLRRHNATAVTTVAVSSSLPSSSLDYQGLKLLPEKGQAVADGEVMSLTRTEFQILLMLFSARGKLFSREEIFESVWPGITESSTRTVDVNISRLRKKLGSRGHHIVSRTGLGYGYME